GEHRVPGRGRVVVEVLASRDKRLPAGRRREEASARIVAEELDREEREATRLVQPAQLAGCDVQLVEAVRDVRVVLEVAGPLRHAVPPRAMQPLSVGERAEQELAELPGGFEPVVAVEPS